MILMTGAGSLSDCTLASDARFACGSTRGHACLVELDSLASDP